MGRRFADRRAAGQALAAELAAWRGRGDVVVLGLPRGGVPVAARVATGLSLPLDVFLVRKLGVPGHAELAMGAIASGGVVVRNEAVVATVSEDDVAAVRDREQRELERRERRYREGRPAMPLASRTVIVVDDGMATGASMRAAVAGLRASGVARLVVAVPVAAAAACAELRPLADEVVCLHAPAIFVAVGGYYDDFAPTEDEEVRRLLADAR